MNLLLFIGLSIFVIFFIALSVYIPIQKWIEPYKDIDDYVAAIFFTGSAIAMICIGIAMIIGLYSIV